MGRLNTEPQSNKAPFAGMLPGETRTHPFVDPKAGEPITLTRTRREFIFDWVDAVNANIPESRGLVWIVDKIGNTKLVERSSITEADKQRMREGRTIKKRVD